jgi:hypothetical protein
VEVKTMNPTKTKTTLRKIAVRKAGSVRLTAAAAALYDDGCWPPGWPKLPY